MRTRYARKFGSALLSNPLPFVDDTLRRRFLLWASARSLPLTYTLEKDIERRNGKDADKGREDHAAKHRRADVAPGQLRRADGHNERVEAEDECERRHHHRAEAVAGAIDRGLHQRRALLAPRLGK